MADGGEGVSECAVRGQDVVEEDRGHAHHHGGHHRHHAPHDHSDSLNQLGAALHLHLRWMGMDFSVPVPADKHNEPVDNGTLLLVVQNVDSSVAPLQTRVEMGETVAFSCACLDPWSTVECVVARYAIKNCLAPALCDTARHERSGVQLA